MEQLKENKKKNPRLTPATPNKQKIYLEPFYIYDDLFNYLVHYFFFCQSDRYNYLYIHQHYPILFLSNFFIFSFYKIDENN
jgi:hypothetical protein